MILKFKEFIKENRNQEVLSDTRYNDILRQDIEDDDSLREYCFCEESNSCKCDGLCDCDFCKMYNKESGEKDYTLYEPSSFINSIGSGKTNL